MNDVPYTTPDEDPFNVLSFQQQPRRRRSSMFEKWLEDQQTQPHTLKTPTDLHLPLLPPSAPFIRYFDTGFDDRNVVSDDASILNSYDLVEDDDIPLNAIHESEIPSTPAVARARPRRTSKILQTPSSFRGFNLSFRSPSPALSQPSESGFSPSSSRLSIFPRTPRHSTGTGSVRSTAQQHNKSSSLSTLNLTGKSPIARDVVDGSSNRWRRSVLGHFPGSSTSQTSVVPSDTVYTPSRPSVSSADTHTSATTIATDSDLLFTPSRGKFMDSIRSRNRSSAKSFGAGSGISSSDLFQVRSIDTDFSSGFTRSLLSSDIASSSTVTPEDGVNTTRLPLATKTKSYLATSNVDHNSDFHPIPQPIKQPDPTQAHIVYSSGGTLPRVNFASLSSRQKKKRKLIVSGVGPKDFKKFEGVKRWCESFGEVSHIMRMPNGDLHVHFRLAEVADTVCRLRAKVHIAGVGSVQLSWSTGDKR